MWLEKEKLLELISQLEPNYNIQRLSQRSSKELFRIYEYLLKNVKLQPKKATRKKVVAIEECEVVYEREEFLSQDEIDLMYPDGGGLCADCVAQPSVCPLSGRSVAVGMVGAGVPPSQCLGMARRPADGDGDRFVQP